MQNRQVMRTRKYLCCYQQIVKEITEKMLLENITNSITINFIECMILHHKVAISMSKNLLEYTKYKPLEEMAKSIIKKQTEEIEQMEQIAKTTYGFSNMPQDVNCYMEKYFEITNHMIEKMKHTPSYMNINLNFTIEMIPHHEGAIAMCENLLKYRIDPRLKCIADCIIKKQNRELEELEQIQKNIRYGK